MLDPTAPVFTPKAPLPQTSSLIHLPAELRNKIFAITLFERNAVTTVNEKGVKQAQPGLLTTCKQIRKEALKFYYYHNTFKLTVKDNDTTVAVRWIQAMGATRYLPLIPKIIIEVTSTEWNFEQDRLCESAKASWNLFRSTLARAGATGSSVQFVLPHDFERRVERSCMQRFPDGPFFGQMRHHIRLYHARTEKEKWSHFVLQNLPGRQLRMVRPGKRG